MIENPEPDVDFNDPKAAPPTSDCETGLAVGTKSSAADGEHGGDSGETYKPVNDWPEGYYPNCAWSMSVENATVSDLSRCYCLSCWLSTYISPNCGLTEIEANKFKKSKHNKIYK